jgi:hypothetical protein
MIDMTQTTLWPEDTFKTDGDERPDPNLADREKAMWDVLFGLVGFGWCVAPPQLIAQDRRWLCVGYNVQGCLEDPSYVAARSPHRVSALRDLGLLLLETNDYGCVRDEHRRLN